MSAAFTRGGKAQSHILQCHRTLWGDVHFSWRCMWTCMFWVKSEQSDSISEHNALPPELRFWLPVSSLILLSAESALDDHYSGLFHEGFKSSVMCVCDLPSNKKMAFNMLICEDFLSEMTDDRPFMMFFFSICGFVSSFIVMNKMDSL